MQEGRRSRRDRGDVTYCHLFSNYRSKLAANSTVEYLRADAPVETKCPRFALFRGLPRQRRWQHVPFQEVRQPRVSG